MKVFRLFAFSDGNITVITRGETLDQAFSWAARPDGLFTKKGATIFPLDYLPINAGKLYSANYSEGCSIGKIYVLPND